MFVLGAASRTFLKTLGHRKHEVIIKHLAPSISQLIYLVGLRVFTDVAPLSPKIKLWLDNGIYLLTVIVFLTLTRRAALLAIEWSSLRSPNSSTLQQGFIPLMRNVITLFVLISGGIMVLKHFDYDVLSLLTALGVGSLAVGLAAKDTLSNMISGFTLIIDRNLRPGDRVRLGTDSAVGEVDEIGLRSTRLKMGDGNMLIVPNAELVNTKILNLSMPGHEVVCSTSLPIPFSVPFPKVREICLATLKDSKKINLDRSHSVYLSGLEKGVQTVTLSFWVNDLGDQGEALSDLHEKLLQKLREAQVEPLDFRQSQRN